MHRAFMQVFGAALLLGAMASLTPGAPEGDVEARRKALQALLKEHWEYRLERNPLLASGLGDRRWNDKVPDISREAEERNQAQAQRFSKRFETISTAGFPEQEALNKTLMVRQLRLQMEGHRLEEWKMPINHISGLHMDAPQWSSRLPFETVKDYNDYIARLKQLPGMLEVTMAHMRLGMRDGLMPMRLMMEIAVQRTGKVIGMAPEESPFVQCLKRFSSKIPAEEQEKIRGEMIAVVRDSTNPAYRKFIGFLRDEYAPKGRQDPGIWSLPNGAARYALAAKESTTTNLTPEEIHQVGLREVARIESGMLAIARKHGYKDLKSFDKYIASDPKFRPTSREQILEEYRKYSDRMRPELPKLFGRLPKAGFVVQNVEPFRDNGWGAQYQSPSPDGKRPGIVQVFTSNPEKQSLIGIEATAYHEGVPGHHLQIAIQQEQEALPPFRQHGGNSAFSEGWALYAEQLAKDAGFYTSSYNDYGRLKSELLRGVRLVLDTGMHHKKWSRDQAVEYFRARPGMDETTIEIETNRYISWPAQVLSYKIGQLTFSKLRGRAEKALGAKFRLTDFHDQCLGAGALPMDVLEARIDAWIQEQAK